MMRDLSNLKIPQVNSTGVSLSVEGDSRDSLEAPQSEQSVAQSKVEDGAHGWSLSPRSTLSCNAVERQAFESSKWTSLQKSDEVAVKASIGFIDDSFRLEDNEALALWEEKEKIPKAFSTDLTWLKPAAGSQSPWLGSVSSAVKKMEILTHAWVQSDSKAAGAATLDCSRPTLDYLKRVGGRSSWKGFKVVSSPLRTSETVLHVSPKVRYSIKSAYRRPDRTELPFSGPVLATPLDLESANKRRHAISCELLIGSSRAMDLNESRKTDDQIDSLLRSDSNQGNLFDAGYAPQRIVGVSQSVSLRQSTKISATAKCLPEERCCSRRRLQSMNEAKLNDCVIEASGQQGNLHSQEIRETKESQMYYASVASRGTKSSRWNSSDDTHMNNRINFVAPSAVRFLKDGEGFSPVQTLIETPVAVPFKWEKEPGKPKKSDSDLVPTSGQLNSALLLPPRLTTAHCPLVSSSSSHNRNMTMSGSLRELYAFSSPTYPFSENQRVLLPWFSASFGNTSCSLLSRSSERPERDPLAGAAREFLTRKSKSVGEVSVAPQCFFRLPVHAGNQGAAPKPYTCMAQQLDQQKPGVIGPPSPTSIFCGPDAGSRASSNDPSLNSEHEAPRVSTTAASPLSQCSLHALKSFDATEHIIDNSSEVLIPDYSISLPFRAFHTSNTSCNSNFDEMRKHLSSRDYQKGETHNENAFVKFCKIRKRWKKTKLQAKLGTNPSLEVWAPSFGIQKVANFGFSAQLGEGSSHSQVQTEGDIVPISPIPQQENLEIRSPACAVSLGLLTSSKKTKNHLIKPPPRLTWKSTGRMQMRARLQARFLVPMRRALTTLLTRFTLRHRNNDVRAVEPKLLY